MPSPDLLREVLGFVSSESRSSVADLVEALAQRFGGTEEYRKILALEAVTKLVQWGLIEVRRDESRLTPVEVERIVRFNPLEKFSLGFSTQAEEMEGVLGLRLDGSPPSLFDIPHKSDSPPYLFVVMPFAAEMDPVLETIRTVGREVNLEVVRGDDASTANEVMKDIWSQLYRARLVVADCTDRNPNVFYEIGLAHAIGKTTILLARTKDDIPFDVQHRRVIFTDKGMAELAQRLEETILYELRQ